VRRTRTDLLKVQLILCHIRAFEPFRTRKLSSSPGHQGLEEKHKAKNDIWNQQPPCHFLYAILKSVTCSKLVKRTKTYPFLTVFAESLIILPFRKRPDLTAPALKREMAIYVLPLLVTSRNSTSKNECTAVIELYEREYQRRYADCDADCTEEGRCGVEVWKCGRNTPVV
jgi:hypothetical protein